MGVYEGRFGMKLNAHMALSFPRYKSVLRALALCLLPGVSSARFADAKPITADESSPHLVSHTEAENILSQAESLPPVYAADLLLRVASGVRFRLPDDQTRFLSSALDLAADVPYPAKLRGLPAVRVDSAAGLEVDALLYGIDRQSLMLRAVSGYLSMGDAAAARRTFQQVQVNPEPVGCGSELAPDFALYYKTAGQLFASAFTSAERARGDDVELLRSSVSGVVSAGQLPPVISLIVNTSVKPAIAQELTNTLLLRMKTLYGEPAVLETDILGNRFFSPFNRLADLLNKQGDASGLWQLLLGLRAMLVVQAASRCEASDPQADPLAFPKLLSSHFAELKAKYPGLTVPDLSIDALKPKSIQKASTAAGAVYWQTKGSTDLLARCQALRDDPANNGIEKASAFLRSVDTWEDKDEGDPLAYFHEKATLYETFIENTADPVLRTTALLHYVSFLESYNNLYASGSLAWFFHLRVSWILALDAKPYSKRTQIISQLQQSQNPVISTYARFLDLLPSEAWAWIR